MYILSDCVRYQQELWGNVVQGRETGILGVIELAIAIAKHYLGCKQRFRNAVNDNIGLEPGSS
jgi:hypothetical protein